MFNILDPIFACLDNRPKLFSEGWGDLDYLKQCYDKGLEIPPIKKLKIQWTDSTQKENCFIQKGFFQTPYQGHQFPEECQRAFVELILPQTKSKKTPVCIYFGFKGDEGFSRRRKMVLPLVNQGIGALILEQPFHGNRKPKNQQRTSFNRVIDFWNMSHAAVNEGTSLLYWLKENGFGPLGVAGYSQGACMANMVGALFPEPLAIVSFVGAHSAEVIFKQGVMGKYCDWETLAKQFKGNQKEAKEFLFKFLGMSDIRNFPVPAHPQSAFLVRAQWDSFMPSFSLPLVHQYWKGSHFKKIRTGHIGSFIFYQKLFQKTVLEGFRQLSS